MAAPPRIAPGPPVSETGVPTFRLQRQGPSGTRSEWFGACRHKELFGGMTRAATVDGQNFNAMSYCVNIPLEGGVAFPNRCPFSGRESPTGTIRLKTTSNSTVTPTLDGFRNSYTKTFLRIPAARPIAMLAVGLEMMIWLSILGGIAIATLLATSEKSRFAVLFVVGGLLAAVGFRIARWIVLKGVRIGNAWNGFIPVRFASESYAKEFSELNHLPLV